MVTIHQIVHNSSLMILPYSYCIDIINRNQSIVGRNKSVETKKWLEIGWTGVQWILFVSNSKSSFILRYGIRGPRGTVTQPIQNPNCVGIEDLKYERTRHTRHNGPTHTIPRRTLGCIFRTRPFAEFHMSITHSSQEIEDMTIAPHKLNRPFSNDISLPGTKKIIGYTPISITGMVMQNKKEITIVFCPRLGLTLLA